MVQMKAMSKKIRNRRINSFISHMVQMKAHMVQIKRMNAKLYIPHGSDESNFCLMHITILNFFISHMVQMKVIIFLALLGFFVVFISHMVQMKGRVPVTRD